MPSAARSGKKQPNGPGNSKNAPPPSKRARRAVPRAKMEAATVSNPADEHGQLAIFMNLPIEIFSEIATHLYPLDLVLLTRANKFFRQLFMRRSAIQVWRFAECNVVGLPPCPRDLCQPQYAALVFTKICSMCGRSAARPMDPVLQVRLCGRCRERHAVVDDRVTDLSLVFLSYNLLPGKHPRLRGWCLFQDARVVKDKLNALALTGDQEEARRWKSERRRIVSDREKEAEALAKYVKRVEEEHNAEQITLKKTREADIHSRLLDLGWIKGDFECHVYWRIKQWSDLVCKTKPLTDEIWDELLPASIPHLELNRKERLEREAHSRLQQRMGKMRSWIDLTTSRSEPYARIMALVESETASGALTVSGSSVNDEQTIPTLQVQGATELSDDWILKISSLSDHNILSLPEFESLKEKDTPLEAFQLELEEMRSQLNKLILDWRSSLEQTLINSLQAASNTDHGKMLVSATGDELALGANLPRFRLSLGSGSPIQSINALSIDMQLLLRADSVFAVKSCLYFYPDDFAHMNSYTTFDANHTGIAKALLSALGRPESTYLELKAVGNAFICGRCYLDRRCKTWKQMIQHYIKEESSWNNVQMLSRVQDASDFTYSFAHDLKTIRRGKPLIRVASQEERTQPPTLPHHGPYKLCRPCKSVDLGYYETVDQVVDHLREVHLINEPQEGIHY